MDENGVLNSYFLISEDKSDSLYPMYFGVSCAFFALKVLSGPDVEDEKWSEIREIILQGSAKLLGLLLWRIQRDSVNTEKHELLQKLVITQREVEELKRRRHEDAKANEKVVSIFAAQEQSWLGERKKLRQQIGALFNEFRVFEKKRNQDIPELKEKLQEMELLIQSKDKAFEEEEQKRKELEEKLKKAETFANELTETTQREAQQHASELWKHKTAFIELVSNQRQLEAEMGRALRQVEAAKLELDSVLEQKEEAVSMVQNLSIEIVKVRRELEQKDQILSVMLRKSKLDTAEKQILLKEVKSSKARRKQAELQTDRWRAVSESIQERHSLRSIMTSHDNSRGMHLNPTGLSRNERTRSQRSDLLEYLQPDLRKESEEFSPPSDQYSSKGNEELANFKQLESWVRSEAEKYRTVIEQRHHLDVDAFTEQLRLKDEKLEAFRWQFLSMELESKRLQSYIEGLSNDMSQTKQANMKLEALLLDREAELHSLKEQFALQLKSLTGQKNNLDSFPPDPALAHKAIWSKVKIIRRKPGEIEQETESTKVEVSQEGQESPFVNQSKDIILTVQSPEKEFEDKDVAMDPCVVQEKLLVLDEVDIVEKLSPTGQCSSKKMGSLWKMDIHALGVSYKIKRLKQQLLMLERLTGKQESGEDRERSDYGQLEIKGLLTLMSLLNKQVSRYQSLQGKTDELCMRMHENNICVSHEGYSIAKTKEETKTLERFLEETFQLQRYMVATGQKLVEIQSKIASGFVGVAEDLQGSASFDKKRFIDSVGTLFRDIQRGLEVRIARIIGDLEGILACDGIIHFRR